MSDGQRSPIRASRALPLTGNADLAIKDMAFLRALFEIAELRAAGLADIGDPPAGGSWSAPRARNPDPPLSAAEVCVRRLRAPAGETQ